MSKAFIKSRETVVAWLFCTPAILLFLIFLIIPFLMAFGLSFTDQRLVPNPNLPTAFVGLRNYLRLFDDPVFWQAVFNCGFFVLVVVPFQTVLALLLAVLVNQKLKGVHLFRTLYFSPVVVIMPVVAVVWAFLFNPQQGFVNEMVRLVSFGALGPYDWLGDTRLAMPAIMVLSVWQGVGFQMIVFLAGLQEIPKDLYRAAKIDGATRWQQFCHITVPMLKNTTVFVVLTTTILAFKLFTQVWVMQGPSGHPQGTTMTMMVYTVQQGFKQGKIGYASAITVVFFLIVLIVSLAQRVFLKEAKAK